MKIERVAFWVSGLLLTALVAGCATRADSVANLPPGTTVIEIDVGKTALSADDLRDLPGMAPADMRARLDVVLASHPDDVAAHFFRAEADANLADFAAAVTDSDVVVVDSSFDPRLRLRVLDVRAEAFLQLKREAEAIAAADQALEIDDSDPTALFARGWARYISDHGQAESALADLNRALLREPDEGIAYFRRSVIFEDQGKFDLATADLDHAAQLAPDDKPIRQQYAVLLFTEWYAGQFRQSIESYREHAAHPDANPYAPLWLFVMRVRANPADEATARAELATLAPALQPHGWRDTIVDLMLGKSTLEAALAEADTASTARLRAGQRCEADYYVAEQLLAHGQDLSANRLLDEAHAICPENYIEARAIIAEQRSQAVHATSH
jgi:lipoprotein NlpI